MVVVCALTLGADVDFGTSETHTWSQCQGHEEHRGVVSAGAAGCAA